MGIQESLNQVNAEMVNRWIKLTGAADPNTLTQYDNASVGSEYIRTGGAAPILYMKNRLGSSGWDLMHENISAGRYSQFLYVDKSYTGTLQNGNQTTPFKTLTAAVDYAEFLNPTSTSRILIYFTGTYNEEVRIHKSYIDLTGYSVAEIHNATRQAKIDNFVATGGVSETFSLSSRGYIWNSQVVTIAGTTWTRRSNFDSSGPTSKHYIVLMKSDGSGITYIQLGNGVKGALAPVGAAVVVTYNKQLPSLVLSNGTEASIDTYHVSDVYSDLVYNPGDPVPGYNRFTAFDVWGLECLGVKGDYSPTMTDFGEQLVFKDVADSYGQFGTNWSSGSNWYVRNTCSITATFSITSNTYFGKILTFINAGAVDFAGAWTWNTWIDNDPTDPNGQSTSEYWPSKYFTDCLTLGYLTIKGNATWAPLRVAVWRLYMDSAGDGYGFYAWVESCKFVTWDSVGVEIASRSGMDCVKCDFGNVSLLGGGPNTPVNFDQCTFKGTPVSDPANRIVFAGPDAPNTSIRYVDSAFTGPYSVGSFSLPYTTPALARVSSATAKIVSKDFVANTDVDTGTETVDSFPDTVGSAAVWTVKISKGAIKQILLASVAWDAATDAIGTLATSTQSNIGVVDVTLAASLAGDTVSLTATATSDDWVVQVVERTIYA